MINYIKCMDAKKSLIYSAFMNGFRDYLIKLEMTEEDFFHRFFDIEGNSLNHSYIAVEDGQGVGVVLSGIKNYEGIKTMRCGALAVSKEYRGKGISESLFKLHLEEGKKNGCKQLFLEVIKGNDRAINFYKKHGYEKIYNISYFSRENSREIKGCLLNGIDIKTINIEEYKKYFDSKDDVHTSWQNDIDYIKNAKEYTCYGAYEKDKIIGCISVNDKGRIGYLIVDKAYRLRGIGGNLLKTSVEQLNLDKLNVAFTNNASLEGFIRKSGFNKQNIEQYEMYKIL